MWAVRAMVLVVLVLPAACSPWVGGPGLLPAAPFAGEETSATASPVTQAAPPRFAGQVGPIDRETRGHLLAVNWRPGCPVPLADLRLVTVSYWNFHGNVRSGPLVLHEDVADDVLWVFRRLFRARFPIHRIDLAPRPKEDPYSTRNLSSSFNCRPVTENPNVLSQHSYGWAIDINPLQNPYVRSDGSVLRFPARPFRDRSRDVPGHDPSRRRGRARVRPDRMGVGWGLVHDQGLHALLVDGPLSAGGHSASAPDGLRSRDLRLDRAMRTPDSSTGAYSVRRPGPGCCRGASVPGACPQRDSNPCFRLERAAS